MQKVEGSSPFSRFTKAPQIARFLAGIARAWSRRLSDWARADSYTVKAPAQANAYRPSSSSIGSEAAGPILEPIGSCGDNEFPVDVCRLELERHPARARRGRR
jgi:hypothetical protein